MLNSKGGEEWITAHEAFEVPDAVPIGVHEGRNG
jgi:hypothetical protein